MTATILIAEDELMNMKLLRDLLQKLGYDTVEATDGEQGVEMTKRVKPALVLMDIMMPKMDGLQATRVLKADASTKNIPVVAVTAFAMTGDKESALEAGCDAYISKPINIHQLLKTLNQFLAVQPVQKIE